jgi:hypothetical protein
MDAEIHKLDTGTALVIAVVDEEGDPVDVSSATKTVYLKKPTGAVLEKAGVNDTTGTDGLMKYVTQSGDLDTLGSWEIQGKVVIGSAEWRTKVGQFVVHPNLA